MYKLIFVDIDKAPDDILLMQLGMLKERNKAKVIGIYSLEIVDRDSLGNIFDQFLACQNEPPFTTIQKYCEDFKVAFGEALVIGDYTNDRSNAGFKVQRPSDMAASYKKAMELLRGYRRE